MILRRKFVWEIFGYLFFVNLIIIIFFWKMSQKYYKFDNFYSPVDFPLFLLTDVDNKNLYSKLLIMILFF